MILVVFFPKLFLRFRFAVNLALVFFSLMARFFRLAASFDLEKPAQTAIYFVSLFTLRKRSPLIEKVLLKGAGEGVRT